MFSTLWGSSIHFKFHSKIHQWTKTLILYWMNSNITCHHTHNEEEISLERWEAKRPSGDIIE